MWAVLVAIAACSAVNAAPSDLWLQLDASKGFTTAQTATPVIDTTSGQVRGGQSKLRPDVSTYLGIPFAKPPVGSLRWISPQRAPRSAGVLDATKFGPACMAHLEPVPQSDDLLPAGVKILSAFAQEGQILSEDCLTLNIWTKTVSTKPKRPVLLWLHGAGDFSTGSSSIPLYEGSKFVDDADVVFVSANYRLNIFGFPGAIGLPAHNLGLLDQRMAVEWVRDNIAAFGGDPKHITLMGESAGGVSVDMYTYAYKNDPIVAAGIAQSGVANAAEYTVTSSKGNPNWGRISSAVGCVGASTLDCMRAKPAKALVDAIAKLPPTNGTTPHFGPIADGKLVFSDYEARGNNGDFAKIPMIIGNTDFEAGLRRFTDTARAGVPINHVALPVWEMYDNVAFSCPAGDAASYRQNIEVPVWRYRYYGSFPNSRIYGDSDAYHSSEIPTLFGTAATVTGIKDTPAESTLGLYMRNAWAAFAQNPNSGLTDVMEWPKFNALGESLTRLGFDNQTVASFSSNLNADSSCASVKCALGIFAEPGVKVTLDNLIPQLAQHFKINPSNGHVGLSVSDDQFEGLVKCGILQSGPPLRREEVETHSVFFGSHKVDLVLGGR
jgi:cholinesterase